MACGTPGQDPALLSLGFEASCQTLSLRLQGPRAQGPGRAVALRRSRPGLPEVAWATRGAMVTLVVLREHDTEEPGERLPSSLRDQEPGLVVGRNGPGTRGGGPSGKGPPGGAAEGSLGAKGGRAGAAGLGLPADWMLGPAAGGVPTSVLKTPPDTFWLASAKPRECFLQVHGHGT